ncbi:MAG: hypothetical protein ACFFDR_07780 [Candidatus Thorarchaeota archaeon]
MYSQADNYPEEAPMHLVEGDSSAERSKKVAVSAVLGAVSIALGATASFIPRIPGWGIALFDPVSIVWVIAFLIGGIEVGIITTYAGFFGLFLFDPTGVGPIFKFLATIPLILIPWIGMKWSGAKHDGGHLSIRRNYVRYMLVAYLVRLSLMMPLNLVIVPALFGISDVSFIIMYTLILNTLQSLWDTLVPFLIVYRTRIFDEFRMW